MNNPHVRRNAPHVLTLESAPHVRRVTSVHNVMKHAQVVAMVGVRTELAGPVKMDITDKSAISGVHICAVILVVIRMERVSNVTKLTHLELIAICNAAVCV